MKSICWLSLLAFVSGCDKGEPEPQFPPLNEARSEKLAPPAGDSAAPSAPAVSGDAGARVPADGWLHFERQDDIPYCLFSRYADWGDAQYVKDAKPKTLLKAGEELHIGVYAPRCAHPDCTRRVNMQCWADVVGTTITLHSRYNGEHYPANTCTKDCEPDTAACSTPPLPAGTYTIEYGAHKKSVRIPGVVKPTCVTPPAR
jgi:hypothetical protein